MNMRIVFVISSLDVGGAERVLSNMANYWSENGWDITIITFSGEELADFYLLHSNVRRRKLGLTGNTQGIFKKIYWNLYRLFILRKEILTIRPQAVISFIDVNNILTILATIGLKLKVIASERTNPAENREIERIWAVLRMWVYRRAFTVVGQTDRVTSWLIDNCKAHAITIPNPLRDLPFPEAERDMTILSVGRLVNVKGFDVLLMAFAQVHENFPDWRLVILGEGPERDNLMALASKLGIAEKVDLPGCVSDPERWMERAEMVVQASRFEGFPNVLMEAMAMGSAVIATDCHSGPAELICDGDNGRLVPVDDIDALAGTIATLMSDPQECRRLGSNGMQIRQRLAQDSIMSLWEDILEEAAASTV